MTLTDLVSIVVSMKLVAVAAVAAAFVGLTGCMPQHDAPGNRYTVYIDPAFSPEDLTKAINACDIWMQAINAADAKNQFVLIPRIENKTCDANTDGCKHAITIHPATADYAANMCGTGEGTGGCTYREDEHNFMATSWDWANSYVVDGEGLTVFLHEEGHAIGELHSPNRSDVMWHSAGPDYPTANDVLQWEWNSGI